MAVVVVKTAEAAETIETVALMVKLAAVTARAAAVHRRGCWFISNVSDVRIMWNITTVIGGTDSEHWALRGFDAIEWRAESRRVHLHGELSAFARGKSSAFA
jgi:hypothetical protein